MRSESDAFYVKLITAVKKQQCPICKKKTKRVHNYRTQHIQGPIISNKPGHHTFYEKLDMVERYQRSTRSIQTTALTYTAVYWALDEVRREVQRTLDKKARIRMKRSKKLLWKSSYKLTEEEQEKVKQLLKIDVRLDEAYQLKNKLGQWFKESDEKTAKEGLETCLKEMRMSNIESFHKVVKTFKRWKQEILQSFMYPFNNGYIEGVNNTIKVTKRMSYGIKSFERLKKKIL
ncbi:hypothetical protein BN1058_02494 [Paraliobacillus sp. PM-2]|uniref:transposase n=1 Tax=Paraliobacillus sp. PM-2 TaxID=1462524 RepID=UPI00061C447E|nr:transposase [Paraliobacillus sp. PM-2]CQR48146.1 hypothetical protein BN1058_02494 [Paraliobacillus sp. PM-2]